MSPRNGIHFNVTPIITLPTITTPRCPPPRMTSLKSRIIYVGVGMEVTKTERSMVHKNGLQFLDLLQKGGQRCCILPNVANCTDCRVWRNGRLRYCVSILLLIPQKIELPTQWHNPTLTDAIPWQTTLFRLCSMIYMMEAPSFNITDNMKSAGIQQKQI